MRLVARIIGGFLLMVALIAALAAYQLSLVHRLLDNHRELARVDLEVSRTHLDLRRQIAEISRLTRVLFVRQDAAYAVQLASQRAAVSTALGRLRALDLAAQERESLVDLDARWDVYLLLAEDVELSLTTPGARLDRDREPDLLDELAAVALALDAFDDSSRASTALRVARSGEQAARARTAAWVSTGVALVCGLLLAVLIARSVARPLRSLGRGTHEMASGNFAFRVPVSGSPELASLARDFNRMADRLGELDRLKKDFLSNVSHDLKAPLASMQETTRLILDGPSGSLSEKQERFLRLQLACGERLRAMIADLLDTARLDSGVVRFDLSNQDLGSLAGQAIEEAQGSATARQLDVARSCVDGALPVVVDRDLLLRAMWNLLSNAAKFSPEGSRIGVDVRRFDDLSALATGFLRQPAPPPPLPCASFEVWDSGPGIPDGQKNRVFDRFYRVDRHHRGEQGSGLGLAIAQMVVTGHDGDLWVEDHPLGGSRFVMLLPLRGDESRGHEAL